MPVATEPQTVKTFSKKRIPIPEELHVLEDGTEIPSGHCVFRIMTQEDGDKRVTWDRGSIPEINSAKDMFMRLLREGMVPYKVGAGGRATSEVMSEFDPSAEEVVFMPIGAIAGG